METQQLKIMQGHVYACEFAFLPDEGMDFQGNIYFFSEHYPPKEPGAYLSGITPARLVREMGRYAARFSGNVEWRLRRLDLPRTIIKRNDAHASLETYIERELEFCEHWEFLSAFSRVPSLKVLSISQNVEQTINVRVITK